MTMARIAMLKIVFDIAAHAIIQKETADSSFTQTFVRAATLVAER
ncbi:MAG: hypothetical protein ACI91G_001240 [Gammaproteobacteria bacterium]|jgi:hypothetical protein